MQEEKRDLVLTRLGEDWVLRQAESNNFRMSRNRASLNYYEAVSQPNQQDRSLHIQEVVSMEDLLHEHASHAATRLGTFWYRSQARYLDQHREQCRQTGNQTLGNLQTNVLEWTIKALDFDEAMTVIPHPIAQEGSGILRIYACERLNWVLPRIEFCTLDGKVKRRFEANDFRKIADGLFFPHHAMSHRFMGNRQDTSEFSIRRVSYTNTKLPDDEFALRVPVKTRVRDSRPSMTPAIFSLQDPYQLDNLLSDLGAPSVPASKNSKTRFYLLVTNGVLLLLMTSYWIFRRCRSRS